MTQKEGGTAGRGRERTLYQEHSAVPLSRLGPPHCPLIAPLSFLLPSPSSSPSCLSSYQPPSQIFPALPQVCPAAQAGSKEHAQTHRPPPAPPLDTHSHMCPELFLAAAEAVSGETGLRSLSQVPGKHSTPPTALTPGILYFQSLLLLASSQAPYKDFILTRGHPTTDHIMFTSHQMVFVFSAQWLTAGLRIMCFLSLESLGTLLFTRLTPSPICVRATVLASACSLGKSSAIHVDVSTAHHGLNGDTSEDGGRGGRL